MNPQGWTHLPTINRAIGKTINGAQVSVWNIKPREYRVMSRTELPVVTKCSMVNSWKAGNGNTVHVYQCCVGESPFRDMFEQAADAPPRRVAISCNPKCHYDWEVWYDYPGI